MTPLSPLRFFLAVSPPSRVLVAVLAILAGAAVILETIDAGASDWVLASIALVQLFAAATGFHRAATRGYYDPILLDGARLRLALAHFVVSASPGIGAWCVTGAAEAVAARSLSVPALRPPGWAALLLVSAIPWAAGLRASRFAVGVLWLSVTASLLVSGVLLRPLAAIRSDSSWAAHHPLEAVGVGLGFPMVIPSLHWPLPVLAGFAGISVLALSLGVAQVARGGFPLSEEGS